MIIHLVCDISGSMAEGGKPFVMRTAVMTVAQWVRFKYGHAEIRLCGWASEVCSFPDWDSTNEYPAKLLMCGGTSDGAALIQLFGEKPDGKVLLLSDGFWSREGAKSLRQWKACLPPDTLRIVKIGADANPQLKGPDVFETEYLFSVLDGWV